MAAPFSLEKFTKILGCDKIIYCNKVQGELTVSRSERKNEEREAFTDKLNDIKVSIKNKINDFKDWFQRQERWKQVLIVVGSTVVTLVLVATILIFSVFSSIFGDIFEPTPDDYDLSLKAVDGYYNILLLGVDARDMTNLEGNRSDAIMVLSINEETSDVKIISVYRDTYLKLGDTPTYDKITHACIYGGPEMTMKTLNQAMDLDISNYVVVNFKAVADLVDAVGGIDVDVEDYEIEELNKYTIETAGNIGYSNYQLVSQAGIQKLDGCQAVSYSRIRKGVGDDFKRTERMRTVISLTTEKMKEMSFKDLRKVIKLITPQTKTNISKGNILGLAIRLPQYNIIGTEGWPYSVTTGYIGGVSYVFPSDLLYNTTKMHQEFFGQADYVPSDTVNLISSTIVSDLEEEREAGKIEGEEQVEILPPPLVEESVQVEDTTEEVVENESSNEDQGDKKEESGTIEETTGEGEDSQDVTDSEGEDGTSSDDSNQDLQENDNPNNEDVTDNGMLEDTQS